MKWLRGRLIVTIFLLAAFLCLGMNSALAAELPVVVWEKNFGGTAPEEGSSVQQTAEGSTVIFWKTVCRKKHRSVHQTTDFKNKGSMASDR